MASKGVFRLTIAALVLAVIVVVLGAFTRLADAGLGCPDWPGCYGHLLWPDEVGEIARADAAYPDAPVDVDKTWPEMVHRYFAGTLLLVVMLITFTVWRNAPPNNIKQLSAALLILIICQAAFGAWTVTLKLWPQIVTTHLLGGFATFSLLWTMFLRQGGGQKLWLTYVDRDSISRHGKFALVVVIGQIALGGWVSSNYAALACADFPTCYGSFTPAMDLVEGFNVFQALGPNYLGGLLDNEARVAVHWVHRIGALVTLVVVGMLASRLIARNTILACLVVGLLALQVTLGVLNVVWSLPLPIATAHNGVGALLLLAMVTINFAPPREQAQTDGYCDE